MKLVKWIQRRWLEFRWGWIYIAYIISSINFITITYYLLIRDLGINISIYLYALIVAAILPVATVSIGHYYHRRHQLTTDVLLTYEPLLREIKLIHGYVRCGVCGEVIHVNDRYKWVGKTCYHESCLI